MKENFYILVISNRAVAITQKK